MEGAVGQGGRSRDAGAGTWNERLEHTLELVRELSHNFDPTAMAPRYAQRLERLLPARGSLLLTRRGYDRDRFGVAKLASWDDRAGMRGAVRFEEHRGGILGDLLAAGVPRIVEEIPAAEGESEEGLLAGRRSLVAIPVLEGGVVVEMMVQTSEEPRAFSIELLPDLTWLVNLHARTVFFAGQIDRLRRAHAKLDADLAYLAELQQALLPRTLPVIPGARLEVHSRPSERSGGDYYDFFALPDGRWGILLADISGHGTVTAVLMAITHAIAHLARPFARPSGFLAYLNRQLASRYTAGSDAFVTACACVFDPATRSVSCSLAGHPAPRLLRGGAVIPLDRAHGAGLGLSATRKYVTERVVLRPGDVVVLFTDGITEARGAGGELFGEERLDALLPEPRLGDGLADAVANAVDAFAGETPGQDDRTVLTLRVL